MTASQPNNKLRLIYSGRVGELLRTEAYIGFEDGWIVMTVVEGKYVSNYVSQIYIQLRGGDGRGVRASDWLPGLADPDSSPVGGGFEAGRRAVCSLHTLSVSLYY